MKKLFLMALLLSGVFGFQANALAASMVFSGAAFVPDTGDSSCVNSYNKIGLEAGGSCTAYLNIPLRSGTVISSITAKGTAAPAFPNQCDITVDGFTVDQAGTETRFDRDAIDTTGSLTLSGTTMGLANSYVLMVMVYSNVAEPNCYLNQVRIVY